MSVLDPLNTTVGDLCSEILKDAGALGIGQTASGEDLNDVWTRLQWELQLWERKRWLIYHLVTFLVQSTGQITPYTVGTGNAQISVGAAGVASRPNRIERAFFQQVVTSPNGPVRYPLKLLDSMEDYVRITLPNLGNFTLVAFYDPAWPVGQLYCWPWPQSGIYSVGIVVREQLPQKFATLATAISLPPEYFGAIVPVMALRMRPKYGITTYPGDELPRLAKTGLATLRAGNTAIAELAIPKGLVRRGQYNIYSDTNY